MTVMSPAVPATITGTALSLPNSGTNQPGERVTFRAFQSDTVVYDMGAAVPINQCALLYTDGTAAPTTVVISGSNDNTTYTNIMGQTLDPIALAADPGYRHYFSMFPEVSYRFYKVAVATSVTFTAGRFVVGKALQVESNADYGDTSWGFEEAPEPDTLDSGVTILEELPAAPYFEFAITWVSEAEMEASWNATFGALQWKRRPVLVVRRPDAYGYRHSGIFWGILRLQPFVAADFDLYEVRGKIRSMV
jgi:hypothetical protein